MSVDMGVPFTTSRESPASEQIVDPVEALRGGTPAARQSRGAGSRPSEVIAGTTSTLFSSRSRVTSSVELIGDRNGRK